MLIIYNCVVVRTCAAKRKFDYSLFFYFQKNNLLYLNYLNYLLILNNCSGSVNRLLLENTEYFLISTRLTKTFSSGSSISLPTILSINSNPSYDKQQNLNKSLYFLETKNITKSNTTINLPKKIKLSSNQKLKMFENFWWIVFR